MKRDEYDGIDAVNYSTLKEILITPAHYQDALKKVAEKKDMTDDERDAEMVRYATGTLTHAKLLEGKDLLHMFAIKPKDMKFSTTDGKEWKAAQTLPILTQAQADAVQFMSDAIAKDPQASAILKRCKEREHAIVTELGSVRVKMLLDAYGVDDKAIPLVPDIKTCQDNSPSGFGKAIRDREYDMQIAWYTRGVVVRYGIPDDKKPTSAWITVLNKRPWLVACYYPSPRMWRRGTKKVNLALERLLECRRTGIWPGWGNGLMEVDYPAWDKEDL